MAQSRTKVDNSLSPHGGVLVERVASQDSGGGSPFSSPQASRLPAVSGIAKGPEAAPRNDAGLAVRDQVARECVNITYGFFSPLEGFMGRADLDSVARSMTLASGYVWSIPILFDMDAAELEEQGIAEGDTVLLTYQGRPLATLEVQEIFEYDREFLCRQVYGTTDPAHPGVQRTMAYGDRFLGGPVTLVNPPSVNPPFDRFWQTPRQVREKLSRLGWSRVVAHQSRNVPHSGHEWMMKGAYLAAEADGILVSAVIGEKKPGDYIDEAIVLTHQRLADAGFFKEGVHNTSALLWDMRYAGPREAVFHALVRKNLGCTHHMIGRDHAGVGSYYGTYAAHGIFNELPDLGIKPVLTLEWWYCPACAGVAYEGLCGHPEQKQELSGTFIRNIIQGGVEPAPLTLRPEVLEVVRQCAEEYGFGSPFVGDEYLERRTPVLAMHDAGCDRCACTCSREEG